jgi:thioredoxin-like negative regulator of GroEL
MILAILFNLFVLAAVGALGWWLSGYDFRITRQNHRADRIRRSIRCAVTLLLVEIIFLVPPTVILLIVLLAVIWAGCIAELASHGFHWLIDPADRRAFDSARHLRELDAVGTLIRNGKKTEAIQLCQTLKAAGEVDSIALELALEHLGVPPASVKKTSPLVEAGELRRQGKFPEAETILNSLLAENPAHVGAGMMLVRLYAEDMRDPVRAEEVLRALEQQPHVPASHIEFARRSMAEWVNPRPKKTKVAAAPQTLDELLARGFFGTAIEILENQVQEQPQDFELQLKLAEVYAVHCANFQRAEKIIRRLEADPNFSAEQLRAAKARQREWRAASPARAA